MKNVDMFAIFVTFEIKSINFRELFSSVIICSVYLSITDMKVI